MVNERSPCHVATGRLGSPGRTIRWLDLRNLHVVTEDLWALPLHRLPTARAAKSAGYEIHVATRLNNGKAAIEVKGFIPHAPSWQRGSPSLGALDFRRGRTGPGCDARRLAGHPAQHLARSWCCSAASRGLGPLIAMVKPHRSRYALRRQSSQERADPSARRRRAESPAQARGEPHHRAKP